MVGGAVRRFMLDWFRARDVARVDLYASAEGEPLHRALGFTDHPDPSPADRRSERVGPQANGVPLPLRR
ncbi:hypothetical protein [Actinacidiphila glaucinigra]|uniref:hypothetical protein n=1 Tax=Actinacidiphila glaucinigra TaxID=235986 RepID=UPI003D8DA232